MKYERIIRDNKEEFYIVNTENLNLNSDLQNLTNVERVLRNENSTLIDQRQEMENTLQMVKTKISQDSLQLRKYECEVESLNRQIMSMENTINLANKEAEDFRRECGVLKENLNNKERENILLKKALEMKDSELQNSSAALNRTNSLLEAHQSNTQLYENIEPRKEYSASRLRGAKTPDYSTMNKKASLMKTIDSMISPYDSPMNSFREQNQPIQNPIASQFSAPRNTGLYSSVSKSLTPGKSNSVVQSDLSNFGGSVHCIDNGSECLKI